jgi:hypothetical protein
VKLATCFQHLLASQPEGPSMLDKTLRRLSPEELERAKVQAGRASRRKAEQRKGGARG